MIIYNVTVSIEDSVHEDWIKWMKEVHIPEVMATGYFTEHLFCKVLVDDPDGKTYSIQYKCANMKDLQEYSSIHAPRLQNETKKRYEGKYVAFRTLLEKVE